MPVNTEEIINACSTLAENRNLTVCVNESAKGACMIAFCAFTGGLLGGPVGLGIGGALGSVATAINGQGRYKSVVEILCNEMNPSQKARLVRSLTEAFKDVGIEEVALVASMILTKGTVQDIAIREITKFLRSEMGYAIAS